MAGHHRLFERSAQVKTAVTPEEKARYRRCAKAAGLQLAEWIRQAMRDRADAEEKRKEQSE